MLLTTPLVIYEEGLVPYTYADPAWGWSVPTACVGETGPHIKRGQTYTVQQCLEMLDRRLVVEYLAVVPCIKQDVTVNQAAAILSWKYNIGTAAACGSTLMKKLNAGYPPEVWCWEMGKWVYANGKKLKGLERRRGKEIQLCLGNSQ